MAAELFEILGRLTRALSRTFVPLFNLYLIPSGSMPNYNGLIYRQLNQRLEISLFSRTSCVKNILPYYLSTIIGMHELFNIFIQQNQFLKQLLVGEIQHTFVVDNP